MYEREQLSDRAQRDDNSNIKPKIADELVKLAAKIAAQAGRVEEMAAERLVPITPAEPTRGGQSEEKPNRIYPSLFAEIRNHLWAIEQALHRIEETIDRVEI